VHVLPQLISPFTLEVVQMILQLALRLRELHALGYVHRDLKPGNVMWLPRENRWTLIDFGCVARTGFNARLALSIKYAAPEVIAAYRSGAQTIIAQVWCCCVKSMKLLLRQFCRCRGEYVLAVMCERLVTGSCRSLWRCRRPWTFGLLG
jgi:serine/threonine protein kinase